MKRGKLCRRGHDEWRRVRNDDKPSGSQFVCVPCRRSSGSAYVHRMTAEEREQLRRVDRRRKKIKRWARQEAACTTV